MQNLQTQTSGIEKFWLDLIQNAPDQGHSYIPKKGEWRASQLPYCGRKQILQKEVNHDWIELEVITQERNNQIAALGSHNVGEAIHQFLQGIIKDSDKIISIEEKVEKTYKLGLEFKIMGHIDILGWINGAKSIVDIKTYIEKDKYNILEYMPKTGHIEQLSIYADIIDNFPNNYLLYVERNNFTPQFYSFSKEKMKERANNMVQKANMLTVAEDKQFLPNRQPLKFNDWKGKWEFNWQCNYCEFKQFCWPNGPIPDQKQVQNR